MPIQHPSDPQESVRAQFRKAIHAVCDGLTPTPPQWNRQRTRLRATPKANNNPFVANLARNLLKAVDDFEPYQVPKFVKDVPTMKEVTKEIPKETDEQPKKKKGTVGPIGTFNA